jgi:hypothetical protein
VSWFPYLGVPHPVTRAFTENFDPTWPQRWTVFGGNWVVRNRTMSTVPGSANGAKAIALATAFTNFAYEADVSVGPSGNAGLVFRAGKPDIGSDAYCGYYAGISAERKQLEFGYASNVWHSITNVPVPFSPNTFYHLKIQASGPKIRIYVNHSKSAALEIDDDSASTGMIGVRDFCANGDRSLSSFANIRVGELPPGTNFPHSE